MRIQLSAIIAISHTPFFPDCLRFASKQGLRSSLPLNLLQTFDVQMGMPGRLSRVRMSVEFAALLKTVATIRCRQLANTKYGNGVASSPDTLVWGTETWYALGKDEGRSPRPMFGRILAVLSLPSDRLYAIGLGESISRERR